MGWPKNEIRGIDGHTIDCAIHKGSWWPCNCGKASYDHTESLKAQLEKAESLLKTNPVLWSEYQDAS